MWIRDSRNPQKHLIAAVRNVILAADPRIAEEIRWKAPTFSYRGVLATFFPHATSYACLLFHDGDSIPGTYPSLLPESTHGRTMRFRDLADLEKKRAELVRLVRAWCEMQDRVAA
jgi:hypothetical protein